jgi:membrane fusion protein (multidrug efflux system)
VEVAKVEVVRLQDDAQSVGTLRSRQSVVLRPEVAGRIVRVGFSDGAAVRQGQVLIQLDDTLQRAELKQAEAQVSISQANFRRNQELVAQNFVAKQVLDEAAANLQVAQAQLALAQARVDRMRILAPFNGVAGIALVSVGDFVRDGADLVNLEDLATMFVDFRLPERYQTRLVRGQPVQLELDALPGRVFTAQVSAVDPLLDADGRSVAVRATLPNTDGRPLPVAARATGPATAPSTGAPSGAALSASAPPRSAAPSAPARSTATAATASRSPSGLGPLRPGMFARVNVVLSVRESALVVPEEAIVPQGGRQFVVKVVAPESLPPAAAGASAPALPADVRTVSKRQEVRLGLRRQGKVEVLDGVVAGETIVVAGQQRLQRDGIPVRVVEAGRPGASAASGGASAPGPAASGPATASR